MADRGKFLPCTKCGIYLWEAHSWRKEEEVHLCHSCFLDLPNFIDHDSSIKQFQYQLSLLPKER
jgi:hypothetical protein